MEYYAKYSFKRQEDTVKCYILKNQEGNVPELTLAKFVDNSKNIEYGIAGKQYMIFTLPRSQYMRKYFAYVFEYAWGKPLTSVEGLNGQLRTFGDGKKIGTNDLILFQFSEDMKYLDMFFVKDMARNVEEKKLNFKLWCDTNILRPKIA